MTTRIVPGERATPQIEALLPENTPRQALADHIIARDITVR